MISSKTVVLVCESDSGWEVSKKARSVVRKRINRMKKIADKLNGSAQQLLRVISDEEQQRIWQATEIVEGQRDRVLASYLKVTPNTCPTPMFLRTDIKKLLNTDFKEDESGIWWIKNFDCSSHEEKHGYMLDILSRLGLVESVGQRG